MKVAIFTSNQPRHISLCRTISEVADEVYVIQESTTICPGTVSDFFHKSEVMKEYFSHVISSEVSEFGTVSFLPENVKQISVKMGDLNLLPIEYFDFVDECDYVIVFGSSYIKGDLCDLLIRKKAVNIHMGVSPYYRGSSCNFWAAYDKNYHLLGSTIHLLSKGLDSGEILFHAMPKCSGNYFDTGMSAVQAAHQGLAFHMKNNTLFDLEPIPQDASMQVRYTRGADFDDEVAREFLNRPQNSFEFCNNSEKIELVRPFRI